MSVRRQPRPLSVALPGLVERIAPRTALAALQTAWPRAAGEAVAAESEPVAERDGSVTIACSSSTWAEQLDLLQGDLLERLEAELGGAVEVSELRFRVAERPSGQNRP